MREGLSYDDVLLVPKHGVLNSRSEADISSELFSGIRLQVPIISANMPSVTGPELAIAMDRAGGIGALPRFCSIDVAIEQYLRVAHSGMNEGSVSYWRYPIVSLGYKDGYKRAMMLYEQGARFFCLDVAHGDHDLSEDFIHRFRVGFGDKSEAKLIVGNIATADAVGNLPLNLIDSVKVGIGPGAACRTREVTGFGVPQLTAIMDVREELDRLDQYRITVIADGGIKNSGDIVKALAAGADTVMVGRLLAGSVEAPDGLEYYGSASHRVNGHRAPEGVIGTVEPAGTVEDIMKELAWGIRSGVSYGGGTNLRDLRQNAEFLRVSPLTAIESSVRI